MRASKSSQAGFTQWAQSPDGASYVAVGNTVSTLEPGYYDTYLEEGKVLFRGVRPRCDDLVLFPDSVSRAVVEGIIEFWGREKVFNRYGLPFKRGILLHGPPGSGKSCTLQMVARDVVDRGGIVLNYNNYFMVAYRALRDIQPDIPVVVLLEDFESTIKNSESRVLNLLDGVEDLHKVVFLATTNYPERLEARIVNRPSRFDQVLLVPHPIPAARSLYLRSLLSQEGADADLDDAAIEKYAKDTAGMSLAHLKELFVATVILGLDYDETLTRLKDMCENKPTSLDSDNMNLTGHFL